MERVIAYVDGFNLYFGLRSSGWRKYYWLDIQALVLSILEPQQQLVYAKYFTARVSAPPDKVKRQTTYLEALETLPAFSVLYGRYQTNKQYCRNCKYVYNVEQEKMTDVNIAVELIMDAYEDNFDTALLISGDADLVGPLAAIKSRFPHKRLVCAFPPKRKSKRLSKLASAYFIIGEAHIRQSQFPTQVIKANGFKLQRPADWA